MRESAHLPWKEIFAYWSDSHVWCPVGAMTHHERRGMTQEGTVRRVSELEHGKRHVHDS